MKNNVKWSVWIKDSIPLAVRCKGTLCGVGLTKLGTGFSTLVRSTIFSSPQARLAIDAWYLKQWPDIRRWQQEKWRPQETSSTEERWSDRRRESVWRRVSCRWTCDWETPAFRPPSLRVRLSKNNLWLRGICHSECTRICSELTMGTYNDRRKHLGAKKTSYNHFSFVKRHLLLGEVVPPRLVRPLHHLTHVQVPARFETTNTTIFTPQE